MKKRFVSLGLVAALVTLIWFVAAFRPAQSRLGALSDDVDQTRQEVTTLQAKLEQLLQLQRNEPEVRAQAGRMSKALPKDQPRVQDVILQIQDAANSAGIDFLTITPSIPAVPPEAAAAATTPATPTTPGQAPAPTASPDPAAAAAAAAARAADPVAKLRSIDMQIKAEGAFFEMESFVLRLEQLARALRIDDLALTATEQTGAPRVGAAMKVRIFMLAPQAAVAAPAPSTTQGTSGAN